MKKVLVLTVALLALAGSVCAEGIYVVCDDGSIHMASWPDNDSYLEVRDVLCN